MEIKVGEYVRTKRGNIGKVIKIRERIETYKNDRKAYLIDWGGKRAIYISQIKDIKHSNNIIDLIEVGDILKLKDGEKWEVQEHQGDGNWIQTEWEVIENEEDFKNKVDTIVTKEQFSSLEYII